MGDGAVVGTGGEGGGEAEPCYPNRKGEGVRTGRGWGGGGSLAGELQEQHRESTAEEGVIRGAWGDGRARQLESVPLRNFPDKKGVMSCLKN